MKPDDTKYGLYRKYEVKRLRDPEGKHDKCSFYVLDLVHDEFAGSALAAYAKACAKKYPQLSKDLLALDVGNVCTNCGGDGVEPDPNCGCREAACPHALTFPGACPKCKGWGIARKRRRATEKRSTP